MNKLTEQLSSEILEPVKERLRHPFFGSFIIIFLTYNWDVWLGMATLSKTEITQSNWIEYVRDNITGWDIFWPVVLAIVYLLLNPGLRSLSKLMTFLFERLYFYFERKNSENPNSYASASMIVTMRKTLNSKIDELSVLLTTVDTDSKLLNQQKAANEGLKIKHDSLVGQNQELETKNVSIQARLDATLYTYSNKFIQGTWGVILQPDRDPFESKEILEIQGRDVFELGDHRKHIAEIVFSEYYENSDCRLCLKGFFEESKGHPYVIYYELKRTANGFKGISISFDESKNVELVKLEGQKEITKFINRR